MKKIRLIKKHIKKKKFHKNTKIYFILILLSLTISIIVIIIIIIFFLRKWQMQRKIQNEINNLNMIYYKGELVNRKQLLKDFLSRVSDNNHIVGHEKKKFSKYFYLPEYLNNKNFRYNIKNKFMTMFSNIKKKPINKIETFFIGYDIPFGNSLININNLIFTCEIVGCNKIILKDHRIKRPWLIKNPIYIKKLNLTIMLGPRVHCDDDTVLCISIATWDPFFPTFVKPQVRIRYIRDELINNLPLVKTEPDELYIHIRGGDVFKKNPSTAYAQPPFCFYEKILDNNKYKNIYILSMDRRNVVLDALMNKYKNIIFNKHKYEYDISLLINAYNLVTSVSSFVISTIKLNDNLKDLWEYDINRLSEKFLFMHHHLYKFDIKYKIHTMKSSDEYAQKMYIWRNTEEQLKLMLEDKCTYDFVLTKTNPL